MRIGTVLLVAVLLIGGLEVWLRVHFWRVNYSDSELWQMVLYSQEVRQQPNAKIAFRLYGMNGTLLARADVPLNNMGFISHRDYFFERETGEFRIVVIGGEQTASTVADRSWPDLLEEELNSRYRGTRYRVINIGWPDAGPEHYIQYWKEHGVRFRPDLVIVNYVESDFFRGMSGTRLTVMGRSISHSRVSYSLGDEPGVEAWTVTAHPEGTTVRSLRDAVSVPSRPYGFFAPRTLVDDPGRVRKLQEAVVADMITGGAPRVFLVDIVKGILRGQGPVMRVAVRRNLDPVSAEGLERERLVKFGVETFGWLVDHVKPVILTHNFNYLEMDARFELSQAMMTRAPRIRVVDMRTRVPRGTDERELRSWYLVPFMGEKWSGRGHAAYARMMAEVVLDWRSGRLNGAGTGWIR